MLDRPCGQEDNNMNDLYIFHKKFYQNIFLTFIFLVIIVLFFIGTNKNTTVKFDLAAGLYLFFLLSIPIVILFDYFRLSYRQIKISSENIEIKCLMKMIVIRHEDIIYFDYSSNEIIIKTAFGKTYKMNQLFGMEKSFTNLININFEKLSEYKTVIGSKTNLNNEIVIHGMLRLIILIFIFYCTIFMCILPFIATTTKHIYQYIIFSPLITLFIFILMIFVLGDLLTIKINKGTVYIRRLFSKKRIEIKLITNIEQESTLKIVLYNKYNILTKIKGLSIPDIEALNTVMNKFV